MKKSYEISKYNMTEKEMKEKNFIVIESDVCYIGEDHTSKTHVVWGGTFASCERYCEVQPHYHTISDAYTWFKPEGGYYRIYKVDPSDEASRTAKGEE